MRNHLVITFAGLPVGVSEGVMRVVARRLLPDEGLVPRSLTVQFKVEEIPSADISQNWPYDEAGKHWRYVFASIREWPGEVLMLVNLQSSDNYVPLCDGYYVSAAGFSEVARGVLLCRLLKVVE